MREIKFRAWNHIVKRMSDCYTIEQLHKEEVNFNIITIMQYTGLKDKNGKEIYEGDVLKNTEHNFTFKVQWGIENESYAGWAGNWNEKDFVSPLFNAPLENCEVIGNIHKNPELLK